MPTDILTTIIELQGLAGSISGLKNLATAAQEAASAFTTLSSGAGGVTATATAFLALAGAGLLVVRSLQGVTQWIGQAVAAGDQLNQSLARTLVLYQNAGRAATPAGISGFALQRLGQAGIAPAATMDLMGQLAERGIRGQLIPGLTRAGQEIEAGTAGRTTAMRAIEMFMRGEFQTERQRFTTQGMLGLAGGRAQMSMGTRMGLSIRFTGNIERDLEAFARAVDTKFGGITESLNLTASGTHQRVQLQLATVTAQLGQVMESLLLPEMEFLSRSLQGTAVAMNALLHGEGGLGRFMRGLVEGTAGIIGGPLGGFLAKLGLDTARQREDLNRIDPNSAQDRIISHLAHIDANISAMAGAMVQVVFGGASSFTRSGFTYGELNRAIGSRR